jgi:predicted metal-dependent hydrolase
VTYTRLAIRDGRSRWGSCSSHGGLNFSWRLILAPPEILDYVVIHELAHRRELNHSPRFWAIVAAHCPAYRQHQRWLRDHGAHLMSILRPDPP